jgi:sucrose-phosphate synthase
MPISAIEERLRGVRRVLMSDIDGTLVGDVIASRSLGLILERSRERLAFGVITGRNRESALEVLKVYGYPEPDIVVSAVGSEIYYGPEGEPELEWSARLCVGWDRPRVSEILAGVPGLVPQAEVAQRPFKLSFDVDEVETVARVRAVLFAHGIQADLVFSYGVHLDVLPRGGSKGGAVRFLAERWGWALDEILVAGDSGNDLDLMICGARAVVVANHQPELGTLRERRDVYFSPERCARGVIDGMVHYGLLEPSSRRVRVAKRSGER